MDDYVKPLLLVDNPDFSGLLGVILQMAAVFGVGVVTSLFQGIFMARVAPGRPEEKSATTCSTTCSWLPIKYFDTHTFGDVMSYYTNDVDTLRQMLSQSIPPDRLQPGDDCDRIHHHAGHQPHPDALRHCPACC